jgi:AcrR family transcriptional regulator
MQQADWRRAKKMKTIREIALELGVSKQRVYRRIRSEGIAEARQEDGTLYYDDAAQSALAGHFAAAGKPLPGMGQNGLYGQLVDALRREGEAKDAQIAQLHGRLAEAMRLAEALAGAGSAPAREPSALREAPTSLAAALEPIDWGSLPDILPRAQVQRLLRIGDRKLREMVESGVLPPIEAQGRKQEFTKESVMELVGRKRQ